MIKPEQVPIECLLAFAEAYKTGGYPEAIAAALNAWPGMKIEHLSNWVMEGADLPYVEEKPAIILPLPQEASDGK